jgi:hypothetical protein
VWWILAGTYDRTVSHKPIFSFAVMLLCGFALTGFLLCTVFGMIIGALIRRQK